jgi:hypothetical protein
MKTTLYAIKSMVEEKYGKLEIGTFYNIEDLKINIETKGGFKPIKSFVVKTGRTTTVLFDSGAEIECSSEHIFMSPEGKVFARDLQVGAEIETGLSITKVSSVVTSDEAEFYDMEVDSVEHTYLTANGINHHNTGKTQNVEDELHAAGKTDGDGYYKVTGSASTAGIYRIMFQNRKNILLFDDSDGALADQDSRNLFKAASDTKKVRKISWQKGGKNYVDADDYNWDEEGEQDELPRSFEFTGKIIFISNLPLNKLDPDGALRTRGYVLNIDPTNAEIYDFMEKIAPKINLDVDYNLSNEERIEVVEILRARKLPEKTANLRTLVRALNTRAGVEMMGGSSDEWKKFALRFA